MSASVSPTPLMLMLVGVVDEFNAETIFFGHERPYGTLIYECIDHYRLSGAILKDDSCRSQEDMLDCE